VVLAGSVAADPILRRMPSGDEVTELRLSPFRRRASASSCTPLLCSRDPRATIVPWQSCPSSPCARCTRREIEPRRDCAHPASSRGRPSSTPSVTAPQSRSGGSRGRSAPRSPTWISCCYANRDTASGRPSAHANPHRPTWIRGYSPSRPSGRSAACDRRSHERLPASRTEQAIELVRRLAWGPDG
jgi:hypothetical protein